MKRLYLLVVILSISCASALGVLQTSHNSLAVAQDLEAQLCWGVADVRSGPANRTVCTSPVAAQVGLTNAKHQQINVQLAKAFDLDAKAATALKAGLTADTKTLQGVVQAILDIMATLNQANVNVVSMTSHVRMAQKKLGGK